MLFKRLYRASNRVWGFSDTFFFNSALCVFPLLFYVSGLLYCSFVSSPLWRVVEGGGLPLIITSFYDPLCLCCFPK